MGRLWILRPIEDDKHWTPKYDKAFGFVVRAETEQEARRFADLKAGDENWRGRPWLSPDHSTCEILTGVGPEGIVLRDFNAE